MNHPSLRLPHFIEPLEARIAPAFVDLVMTIDSLKLPDPNLAVPGDDGTITYTIANEGDMPFTTTHLDVNIWLSKQTGPIPNPIMGDISLHAKYRTVVDGNGNLTVSLQPGGTVTKTTRFTIPDLVLSAGVDPRFVFGETPFSFSPGAGFHLVVEVDPGFAFDFSAHANNSAASDPFALQYQFGQVGARSGVNLSAMQSDGTLISFGLTGPGRGEVQLHNTPTIGNDLVFTGTSAASFGSAGIFKTGTFGRITLDKISSDGPMKGLNIAKADVTGNLTFAGALGGLKVGNLGPGNQLQIGGLAGTDSPVTIVAGRVNDFDILANAGIADLQVIDWGEGSGADNITAPFLSDLSTTGDKAATVAGDFAADIFLSGADKKGFALGKTKIAGQIKNNTFNSTSAGKIGDITAASASQWSLNVQGDADDIGIAGNLLGATALGLTADSFSSIKIGGTLGNHITATGDNGKMVGIKSVVAKSIDGIKIKAAAGGIEKVEAGDWNNGGELSAVWVKAITTKGGAGVSTPGDFTATVKISGPAFGGVLGATPIVPKGVTAGIGTASILGALKGAAWQVKWDIGTLTAGSLENTWTLAGEPGTSGLLATDVNVLKIKGKVAGALTANSFGTVEFGDDFNGVLMASGSVGDFREGSIGSFKAENVVGATLSATGPVKKFEADEWTGGSITAFDFGDLKFTGSRTLTGSFSDAILTVTGPTKTQGIGKLIVHGSMGNVTINVPNGFIQSIAADEWLSGIPGTALVAQNLLSLALTGDKARGIRGDLTVVRMQIDDAVSKVGKITVAGFIDGSTLQFFGSVGAIQALGFSSTNISVAGGHSIDSVVVKGKEDGVIFFKASNISASTIGTVLLNNVDESNTGAAFGVTTGFLGKYFRTEDGVLAKVLTNVELADSNLDNLGKYKLVIT